MALTKQKSETVSKATPEREKKDARVVRTLKRIDHAFVELLQKRAYGNIHVSDITRKARLGRATFYAHYSSKDELLRSQFSRGVAPLPKCSQSEACPVDASLFFAHVQSAPVFYRALMSSPNAGSAPRIIRHCIEWRIEQHISQSVARDGKGPVFGVVSPDLQNAITARCVASSLFAVIECALEHHATESPQALQTIFSTLVGEGLTALTSPEK